MKQLLGSMTALYFTFMVLPLATAQHLPTAESCSESARALCNAGVDSFQNARYEDAASSFRKAAALAPGEKQPHFYLGLVYSYQVVPNLDTPVNLKIASAALDEFAIVLKDNPKNLEVLRQEASVYRNIKELEKAREIEKQIITVDPSDAEAYYTIGVMDWIRAYKNSVTVLAKENLTDDGMGNVMLSNAGCDALEQKNAELVDEAMTSLQQAIRLRVNYDDAMQYLNLIYRRHAELHCHDRSAAEADIKNALKWSGEAMKARKVNEAMRLLR